MQSQIAQLQQRIIANLHAILKHPANILVAFARCNCSKNPFGTKVGIIAELLTNRRQRLKRSRAIPAIVQCRRAIHTNLTGWLVQFNRSPDIRNRTA